MTAHSLSSQPQPAAPARAGNAESWADPQPVAAHNGPFGSAWTVGQPITLGRPERRLHALAIGWLTALCDQRLS